MKRIRFKEIAFLSYSQRAARRINLNNDVVVISGGNQSGKSCILKSLYYTLGATIQQFAERWADANIITLLKFSIDGVNYKAVRIVDDVYLFNPDGSLRFHQKDRYKVAKAIGNLLGSNIDYKDSNGRRKTLSLGHLFMPFYVDQDKGWNQPLDSFGGATSIGGKHNALLYISGIIDDDYYVFKTKHEEAQTRQKEVLANILANSRFSGIIRKRFQSRTNLVFTETEFKQGMDVVIKKVEDLKEEQTALLQELEKLYGSKYTYQFNINQLKDNVKEIDKDFNFAVRNRGLITCPMCGAQVENDEYGRLLMLDDRDRCKDQLIVNSKKLQEVEERIREKETLTNEIREKISDLQATINQRNETISLNEMFEARMREYFDETMTKIENELNDEKTKLETEILSYKGHLKSLNNNEKKKLIEKDFVTYAVEALAKMDIGPKGRSKVSFGGRLHSTGSSVIRYIVAYLYSYYYVMQRYDGLLFAPIVIDEPKQRGLDEGGLNSVLNFIMNSRPNDSQLIISLTDNETKNLPEGVKVIQLESKQDVLKADEYKDVREEIEHLIYSPEAMLYYE